MLDDKMWLTSGCQDSDGLSIASNMLIHVFMNELLYRRVNRCEEYDLDASAQRWKQSTHFSC